MTPSKAERLAAAVFGAVERVDCFFGVGADDWTRLRQTCPYCGYLDWTVKLYGVVVHKGACPHRTTTYSQSDPPPTIEAEPEEKGT